MEVECVGVCNGADIDGAGAVCVGSGLVAAVAIEVDAVDDDGGGVIPGGATIGIVECDTGVLIVALVGIDCTNEVPKIRLFGVGCKI